MKRTWCERTRIRLRRLGRTQTALAAAVRYSPSYLCDVLQGRRSPRLERMVDDQLSLWEQEAREAALHEADTRAERLVCRRCPVCGKEFRTVGTDWGYKLPATRRRQPVYFCSWHCFRTPREGGTDPV